MPRPFKNRCINSQPIAVIYKPAGIPAAGLKWIQLTLDEYECIRLIDHLGLEQGQAADKIGVSRPTVTRIYASARKKISDALVLGQALRIEGGPIVNQFPAQCRGMGCQKRHRHGHGHNHQAVTIKTGSNKMKIVVCAQGNNSQSPVDSRFGRSAFWAVFDIESKQYDFVANHPDLQAVQGAGIQAAQAVLDADAGVLIACNVGPKAMAVLKAGNVEVFQSPANMTVEQAVEAYQSGQLGRIENANVEGHWV